MLWKFTYLILSKPSPLFIISLLFITTNLVLPNIINQIFGRIAIFVTVFVCSE